MSVKTTGLSLVVSGVGRKLQCPRLRTSYPAAASTSKLDRIVLVLSVVVWAMVEPLLFLTDSVRGRF